MSPEEIKRIRSVLGWSQERFARELGVSFCTVNRWERGKTSPSPMGLNALKSLKGRSSQSERRRFIRSSIRCPVSVDIPAARKEGACPKKALTGFTEDLSHGGLMFSFDPRSHCAPLKAGDELTFRLIIGEGRWAEIPSVVRWTAARDGRARAGVMYSPRISGDTAAMVDAVLSD